jgi:hypothetical protein
MAAYPKHQEINSYYQIMKDYLRMHARAHTHTHTLQEIWLLRTDQTEQLQT